MLHAAASLNLLSAVGDILVYGGDVNTCNDDGEHPIFAAARQGHVGMVRQLHNFNSYLGVTLFAGAYLGLLDIVMYTLNAIPNDVRIGTRR